MGIDQDPSTGESWQRTIQDPLAAIASALPPAHDPIWLQNGRPPHIFQFTVHGTRLAAAHLGLALLRWSVSRDGFRDQEEAEIRRRLRGKTPIQVVGADIDATAEPGPEPVDDRMSTGNCVLLILGLLALAGFTVIGAVTAMRWLL